MATPSGPQRPLGQNLRSTLAPAQTIVAERHPPVHAVGTFPAVDANGSGSCQGEAPPQLLESVAAVDFVDSGLELL